MEKIKAAVIGLGRIGSLLEEDTLREKPCTHAGAIAANKNCILTAGCDINEKRRLSFARKWNVPVFKDAALMLSEIKPQILAIATHPDSHYHYCRIAFENKIPVIICEKPLADSLREAKLIEALAKQTKIIVNHERRYSLDYIRVKTILEEKKLGKLIAVRAVLYMGKSRRLLDMLWHDGTHIADAIMFLTNSTLKHKNQWGAKLDSKTGTAWLEGELYSNQNKSKQQSSHSEPKVHEPKVRLIPVIIEIGSERDHLVFEIEFSCESGRLRIGNGIFEVWQSIPSPYAEKFNSLEKSSDVFSGPTGYFANMFLDAVNCVNDPNHIPVSGAIDGLRVIEYLNSVKKWEKKQ